MYISMCLYIVITVFGCSLYILLISIIPSSFYANHTTKSYVVWHQHAVKLQIVLSVTIVTTDKALIP